MDWDRRPDTVTWQPFYPLNLKSQYSDYENGIKSVLAADLMVR